MKATYENGILIIEGLNRFDLDTIRVLIEIGKKVCERDRPEKENVIEHLGALAKLFNQKTGV